MRETLETLVAELIATGRFEADSDAASPRARIARAALELFAERSYEGTTTKAIASRAKTTERTLFKHYVSKELLFARTVFPAFLKALIPVLFDHPPRATLRQDGDFRSKLRWLLVDRITFATEHPALVTMVWRELLTRSEFRELFMELFEQYGKPALHQFIASATNDANVRSLPLDVTIRAISGQLIAYLVARLVIAPEQSWDTEADADQILELIMAGIGAHRAAPAS